MSNLKTPQGRLREDGARAILRARESGETYQKIAQDFGVSLGTVYNIVKGRTWAWLRETAPASAA